MFRKNYGDTFPPRLLFELNKWKTVFYRYNCDELM
jgi:hypothetical protein